MLTLPIRIFGQKYQQNLNKAPLVITKGGTKAFIILPYDESLEYGKNYVKGQAGFTTLDIKKEGLPPELTLEDMRKHFDGTPNHHPNLVTVVKERPLLEKIKTILTRKVF